MKYPFAIMDYGIGGLGLYKLIRKDFPDVPLIYFSDSGAVPYGKLSARALRTRVEKVLEFLRQYGTEKILVACHSASSVIRTADKDVIDIRRPTLDAVRKSTSGRIRILGGGRTIRSGYYRDALEKQGLQIEQKNAQVLSILVERGEVKSPAVTKAVKGFLTNLDKCDGLLLACTHYPVLIPEFKKHIPNNVTVIDPTNELFKSIRNGLARLNGSYTSQSIFLTTGNAKLMKQAALTGFGVRVGAVKKVKL